MWLSAREAKGAKVTLTEYAYRLNITWTLVQSTYRFIIVDNARGTRHGPCRGFLASRRTTSGSPLAMFRLGKVSDIGRTSGFQEYKECPVSLSGDAQVQRLCSQTLLQIQRQIFTLKIL